MLDALSPPTRPDPEDQASQAAFQPPGGANDPRFHGPGHPMYGKNYYQACNEILNEMHRARYSEEQIKLVYLAMEATKCPSCNGYGQQGQYRCEACKGDGVLEN